ncbi:hypothetical protein MRB53_008037 [Persea americana]|uniref:Uncharacterized protein n=1 Tax=Persea americana TaxID=3435 RepID=A0ACC2MLU8_PERAE|nr:hypothetical protein MRB53_008037 [Persea americana]
MAKEYCLSKVLPPLVRLSELVSTSDHFRVLGGFDFEEAAGFGDCWISLHDFEQLVDFGGTPIPTSPCRERRRDEDERS